MTFLSHETIRLKLAAFFFNSRADALRGELFRALSISILARSDQALDLDEICQGIIQLFGLSGDTNDSLRAVLVNELATLVESGELLTVDEKFQLADHLWDDQPTEPEIELLQTVSNEIETICRSIEPAISRVGIKSIFEFYVEASVLIAEKNLSIITKGRRVETWGLDSTDVATAVSEKRVKFDIDRYLDGDKFIRRSFISPPAELAKYLYHIYQAAVAINLLAWDPSLNYLERSALSNMILYVDSSVLFALMQETHPLHQLVDSLISASKQDLGVQIYLHADTLEEYESVLKWHDIQFLQMKPTLVDVAKACKRDGSKPSDWLELSIFTDYLDKHLDHIDEGSWNRYRSSISGDSLKRTAGEHKIKIDKSNAFVPVKEYHEIREALLRASKIQVKRGKRSEAKHDTTHDARIFYLISTSRKRIADSALSLGFDRYLLTLDGSLTFFLREYGVPWTETYFMFPFQWYEFAFPFMRIKFADHGEFASGIASLIFSPAFPQLDDLIPLNLCKFVFEQGGKNLPMGSVQQVVSYGLEERLIEKIDPSNMDVRGRQQAQLDIQRIIAQEEMQASGEIEQLKRERESISEEIKDLGGRKTKVAEALAGIEEEYGKFESVHSTVEAVREIYEEEIEAISLEHQHGLEQSKQQTSGKEHLLNAQDSKIEGLEYQIDDLSNSVEALETARAEERRQLEEAKANEKAERIRRINEVKRISITVIMVLGLLVSNYLLITANSSVVIVLASSLLLVVGTVLYQRIGSAILAFIAYGMGVVVSTAFLINSETANAFAWLIPLAWEVVVFGLDRILQSQSTADFESS